jgi:predicted negative regulator of RcsB-dependent stress response
MSKSGRKHRDEQAVDGRDRVMESVASVTVWAERNRRTATFGLIALLLAVAAGLYYVRYRSQLSERAAVQLDDIRMTSRGATPEQLRQQLRLYVDQFGGARQADEARVMLAEMEMQRDSVDAALRLIAGIADPAGGPVAYHAATMIAAAEEQRGNLDAAARQYERLVTGAQKDFQKRAARANLARIEVYRGNYDAAETIYAELAEETEGQDEGATYAIRLGEVRARSAAQLPPPTLPAPVATAGAGAAGEAVAGGDSTAAVGATALADSAGTDTSP